MIDEEKRNDASGFSSLRFMAGVSGIGMEREELTCTTGVHILVVLELLSACRVTSRLWKFMIVIKQTDKGTWPS